jgi:hypothetical protein
MNRDPLTKQLAGATEAFCGSIDPPASLTLVGGSRGKSGSPWLRDSALLGVALWWVKETQAPSSDFPWQVAREFNALARDLRRGPF